MHWWSPCVAVSQLGLCAAECECTPRARLRLGLACMLLQVFKVRCYRPPAATLVRRRQYVLACYRQCHQPPPPPLRRISANERGGAAEDTIRAQNALYSDDQISRTITKRWTITGEPPITNHANRVSQTPRIAFSHTNPMPRKQPRCTNMLSPSSSRESDVSPRVFVTKTALNRLNT